MRIHLLAAARPFERASRPLRSAFLGQGVANLTLPYLAALIPRRHEVTIQDEQSAPLVLKVPIDLALVTTKTCYAPRAYEIADRLRARGVPVVLGGCHVSLNPEEAARHCDTLVVGEAEAVMPQLLEDAEAGRLAPIYRGRPADLSATPRPRRELLQKRYLVDAMVVSRGCNYSCRFCCVRDFYGPGFRARPVGDVIEEVRELGTYLGFLDENLVGDRAYARELFEALEPLSRRWLAQVSADILEEPELIPLAARAGARGVHIGFETINPANLRSVAKGQNDVSTYAELVRAFHAAGVLVAAGLIFGLEGDTRETFPETLEAMTAIGVDLCYFKILTPYPGTDIYRKLESEGRILTRDWSWYDGFFPTFVPRGMTPRELFEGTRWARNRFYSAKSIASRVGRYLGLRMPLWASLNMNRLAKAAYRHSETLGELFLQGVGQ